MSLSEDIGGFLSILIMIITFIASPFISYLSQLEAIEEMFKAKSKDKEVFDKGILKMKDKDKLK
jgi:hypothetical protein